MKDSMVFEGGGSWSIRLVLTVNYEIGMLAPARTVR